MIKRTLADYALQMAEKYPVVTITGPRQSGKTTLARQAFPDKPYANLEHPVTRAFAQDDPAGFLAQFRNGAIIDEIQRVPLLLSYIQVEVDEKRQNNLYVLTGSQQFNMSAKISQSLAGRTAILYLLPFSLSEVQKYGDIDLDNLLFRGFYPRIYEDNLDPVQMYGDYFETYIERDLRQLSELKNIALFEKFIRLCAGRVGQLLNLSSLANDTGISQTTAREWISLLQTSFVIFLLQPFHANIRKRLVKTPKIYFYDVGLAAWLCGVETAAHIRSHPLRGHFFENMMIAEILKFRFNMGRRNNLTFFRDNTGNEVDVLYHVADEIIPIEIKAGQTITSDYFKNLKIFSNLGLNLPYGGFVVYAGEVEQKRRYGHVLNFRKLTKKLQALLKS